MTSDTPLAKEPWRKRHPVLFWMGAMLLVVGAGHAAHWAAKGPLAGPKIAEVHISGVLLDADDVVDWLETITTDASVRAVVVRINSPGGAVAPSQELYRAVKRAAQTKPVVVSMGAVAASGGYYAALGSREIFAAPSTLTASIGVKLQLPNVEGLMRTLGLSERTLTTGALKDAGSPSRSLSPEEHAYFQALIDDMFEEFISTVMQERGMNREQVLAVADGRAMTGRQALAAGLVDKLGDHKDALLRAKELGRFPPDAVPAVISGPAVRSSLLREILGVILDMRTERGAAAGQPLFFY